MNCSEAFTLKRLWNGSWKVDGERNLILEVGKVIFI
jgi:hypothetical protein